MAKVHSMSVKEFMARKDSKKTTVVKVGAVATIGASLIFAPETSHAMDPTTGWVADKMMDIVTQACDPIIEVLQALAYPAGIIGLTVAGVKMMLNQRDGSVSAIQAVGIGYLMIQSAPWFMDLLKMIVSGVN